MTTANLKPWHILFCRAIRTGHTEAEAAKLASAELRGHWWTAMPKPATCTALVLLRDDERMRPRRFTAIVSRTPNGYSAAVWCDGLRVSSGDGTTVDYMAGPGTNGVLPAYWRKPNQGGSRCFDVQSKPFRTEKLAREAANTRAASYARMHEAAGRAVVLSLIPEPATVRAKRAPAMSKPAKELAGKLELWAAKNGLDLAGILSGKVVMSHAALLAAVME